jgi:hypothetical protein
MTYIIFCYDYHVAKTNIIVAITIVSIWLILNMSVNLTNIIYNIISVNLTIVSIWLISFIILFKSVEGLLHHKY